MRLVMLGKRVSQKLTIWNSRWCLVCLPEESLAVRTGASAPETKRQSSLYRIQCCRQRYQFKSTHVQSHTTYTSCYHVLVHTWFTIQDALVLVREKYSYLCAANRVQRAVNRMCDHGLDPFMHQCVRRVHEKWRIAFWRWFKTQLSVTCDRRVHESDRVRQPSIVQCLQTAVHAVHCFTTTL